MRALLLASVMALALTGIGHASDDDDLFVTDDSETHCFRLVQKKTLELKISDTGNPAESEMVCMGNWSEKYTYDEELIIAKIVQRAQIRAYNKFQVEQVKIEKAAEREREAAERERVRISQCTVPLFKIGCPPK
jgi:hypothetical protein